MRSIQVPVLAFTTTLLCGISRAQETAKLPFTVSKETTAIVAPLNPDGTVDYITAINQLWGKDVKPEDNAFVGLLEAVGTNKEILGSDTKDKIIGMCGAKDVGKMALQSYEEFLKSKNIDSEPPVHLLEDLGTAQIQLWNQRNFPLLAEYLINNTAFLKRATDAFSRPKYWFPCVPLDGRSFSSVVLPSLNIIKTTCTALRADATRRAAAGDFQGFLSEILAVKRIAIHLRSQPTIIENLIGVSINNLTDQTIGAVAGSGKLSAQDTVSLSNILTQLPAAQQIAVAVDITERWSFLDRIALLARGEFEIHGLANDSTGIRYIMLDLESIDWNTVLKRVNAMFDAEVDAMHQPTFAGIAEKMKLLSARIPSRKNSFLGQQPDESREAYTTRVANSLIADFLPSFNNTQQLSLASSMCDQMATAMVAAARYHAEKGKWPDQIADLLPTYVSEIPRDVWSLSGTDAVKYVHDSSTASVYSVGRNHIDDGGLHNPDQQQDDIVIGQLSQK